MYIHESEEKSDSFIKTSELLVRLKKKQCISVILLTHIVLTLHRSDQRWFTVISLLKWGTAGSGWVNDTGVRPERT